jgi:hypothetical protein
MAERESSISHEGCSLSKCLIDASQPIPCSHHSIAILSFSLFPQDYSVLNSGQLSEFYWSHEIFTNPAVTHQPSSFSL